MMPHICVLHNFHTNWMNTELLLVMWVTYFLGRAIKARNQSWRFLMVQKVPEMLMTRCTVRCDEAQQEAKCVVV